MAVQTSTPETEASGCSQVLWVILAGIWIAGATIIALSASSLIEQAMFQESRMGNTRWVVALGYAASMLPIAVAAFASRSRRNRSIYSTWALAALLALLSVPARFLSLVQFQLASLAQIAALLLFLLVLLIFRKKAGVQRAAFGNIGWAAGGAAAAAIPWVLWGALGSPVDTLLGGIVGLLIGLDAVLLIDTFLLDGERRSIGTVGLVFALALLIMAAGVGQSNEQWMLAATLPVIAWAALALVWGNGETAGQNWPAAVLFVGLVAALPLTWVDPDELAAVVSMGSGELLDWAGQIVLTGFLTGLGLSLIFLSLRRFFAARASDLLAPALAVLAVGALAALYLLVGQPGFYGERLFVIFSDQLDTSPMAGISDIKQRRAAVYTGLVEHANTTQADVRARLDQMGIPYTPYYLVNALEVQGGPLLQRMLLSQPGVERIIPSPVLRPLPEPVQPSSGDMALADADRWNLEMIGAERVWNELQVSGAGIVVGQSDSGVQGDHAEVADSYRGRGGQNDYNWFDPWNGSTAPVDIGGHGTHTLGSVLGDHVGVAPDAEWIGCVNLARNLGNPALYLDCMQFMLAPFPQGGDPFTQGDPARGADVLNNSWGCPPVEGCDPDALLPAVRALRNAGVFVVVSAGNSGYSGCGTVEDPPAIYDEVYSVGAVDSQGNLAGFSSRGPVEVDGSGRTKPDIVAPGVDVFSSFPNSTYAANSGTSMAGPHVAGVVALMWSANPGLIGDIDRTTQILNETARPFRGPLPDCSDNGATPNNAYGYGVVDAYAAVKAAQEAAR